MESEEKLMWFQSPGGNAEKSIFSILNSGCLAARVEGAWPVSDREVSRYGFTLLECFDEKSQLAVSACKAVPPSPVGGAAVALFPGALSRHAVFLDAGFSPAVCSLPGLCALSINHSNSYVAYPGSLTTGEIVLYDGHSLVS